MVLINLQRHRPQSPNSALPEELQNAPGAPNNILLFAQHVLNFTEQIHARGSSSSGKNCHPANSDRNTQRAYLEQHLLRLHPLLQDRQDLRCLAIASYLCGALAPAGHLSGVIWTGRFRREIRIKTKQPLQSRNQNAAPQPDPRPALRGGQVPSGRGPAACAGRPRRAYAQRCGRPEGEGRALGLLESVDGAELGEEAPAESFVLLHQEGGCGGLGRSLMDF